MKYGIKLVTYDTENTAEEIISKALGFNAELSHGTLIDIFSKEFRHFDGVFISKKSARAVANFINARGAFGGFGKYSVIAVVVEQNA